MVIFIPLTLSSNGITREFANFYANILTPSNLIPGRTPANPVHPWLKFLSVFARLACIH